ncbi:hypothetical protein [Bacillus velezensis]|uniref:hypothetical protein n=1 Tax=Bacillus velezensis TaxID=492670 RepID=UPI0020B15C76|nr:hypothetical protein [Bacillus velezensis]
MLAKENKQSQSTYSDNLYKNIVEGAKKEPMFQAYLETEYFREKVIDLYSILNSITHKHKIAANLHLIKAAGNKEKKDNNQFLLYNWEDFTERAVHYYNGFGEHGEMLSKDYLSGNTALITDILKKQKNIHYLIKECNI